MNTDGHCFFRAFACIRGDNTAMSNRIDDTFAQLRAAGKKGLIAYMSAGDPNLAATRDLALALEKAGVDILELGVPFSDPLADGIVNQLAAQRALEAGTTPEGVLECVKAIRRDSEIPIVLYTYLNPLLAIGIERFTRAAEAAGVDGTLILDLPPDEDNGDLSVPGNVRRIRLIAPTTPTERIARIASRAEGFIYYVSREGVTGEQASISTSIGERVAEIRKSTALPIAVGFGISTPEQAAEVARSGDAVVVGSAIVKRIAEFGKAPDLAQRVADFVRPLAEAVRSV
jgi:tryptophan synthase alpha chain